MKAAFSWLVIAGLGAIASASDIAPFKIHGRAWTEAGKIMNATDTAAMNWNGNWIQSMGGQFTAIAELGRNFEGVIGFGGYQVYHSLGNADTDPLTLGGFRNFITEAHLTYFVADRTAPRFSLTLGNFDYNYHPQIKNLGLYLLRGPVYPGFLVSGFQMSHTDSARGNVLGAHAHNSLGNFRHDLILSLERELPPSMDWSLAYVARYKAFGALEIGAGVNFYHLISENEELTTPGQKKFPGLYSRDIATMAEGNYDPRDLQYIEVTPSGDTVFYTHRGTKLMAMFELDVKPWLGLKSLGPDDLVLYSEAAVIGVENYGSVYDDIWKRIPVMLGANLPCFGFLDYLSLEVEWYGADYPADYSKLGLFNSLYNRGVNPSTPSDQPPLPSPIPVPGNAVSDNWKWSVNAQKTVHGHVRFIGQIANDHFIPRPARAATISEIAGLAEAFSSSEDWYFMFRLGYFF